MKYKSISTKKKIELFPSDQYKCKYEGGTPLKWTRFRSKGRFSNEWLSYEFRRPQKIKVVKKLTPTNTERDANIAFSKWSIETGHRERFSDLTKGECQERAFLAGWAAKSAPIS